MQKLFFGFIVTLFLSTQFSFAQSYALSGIEKSDKEDMQYEVLGKVGNHYWIYKKNGTVSSIAQYNAQMQLVKQNDMPYLPASLSSIEFVAKNNKVIVFYQFQSKTTVYAFAATLNEDGQLASEPKLLDTAENIRPGSNAKVYNLLQSNDGQRITLFSVNTTRPQSIKIKVLSFNSQFELVNDAVVNVNGQNKKSVLSDFALDNNGNLFCLRNMTLSNAAPAVSLLYLAADGSEVVESPILNNTLLLDDIRLKVDNNNGSVILNSFYATTQKGNLEGLFTFVWDIKSKTNIASNASRFTDAIRAVVSSKRKLKDAFDDFYIDRSIVQPDGSIVIIAEAAETYSNRVVFSRWDYFYGGAFYNPFLFSYWNRPFGFYPWGRFGLGFGFGFGFDYGFGFGMSPFMWGGPWMNPYASFGYPSVTYKAEKVAFITLDAKGNVQSAKVIDKKQSDVNTDQFIGYGVIENEKGSTILYHKKEKGVSGFIVNTHTTDGQLTNGDRIVLNEKKNEWMSRALKQVGSNEAIVPYQFKNKIGFAKIQIK